MTIREDMARGCENKNTIGNYITKCEEIMIRNREYNSGLRKNISAGSEYISWGTEMIIATKDINNILQEENGGRVN